MPLIEKKPVGVLRVLFRLPIFLYKIKLGCLLGERFLMLAHVGRKSGLPRQVVIEVVHHNKETGVYYIAAAWGGKADWYLNILKNPRVMVQVGNRRFDANANQTSQEEAMDVLWEYARKHPFALRELTVVMTGKRLPPTQDTCKLLSDSIPVISLHPIQ